MLPICGLMWFLRKPSEVLNVDDRSLILRSSPSSSFWHKIDLRRNGTQYRKEQENSLPQITALFWGNGGSATGTNCPHRSIHRSFVSSLTKAWRSTKIPADTAPATHRKEPALQCHTQYTPCGGIPAVPDSRPAGNRQMREPLPLPGCSKRAPQMYRQIRYAINQA